ncbi:hypothetical protein CAter282_4348 [Collimonas arenae]|uniref:Uncharacterized protein n=1 Tax=Collimonas arenae TaxID=279058 RepID=A0A127PXK9_9BURK|nr:hypothetical protein CAter10_4724 [Collimonas arenae]AMP12008.1 hypothetical protein CAter282_4348 [Collimonas arenae]
MPYTLNVRRDTIVQLAGALDCLSLSCLHITCSIRVCSPDGIVTLFTLFNVHSLVSHFNFLSI